jgi:hypothetical protein
MTIEAFEKRKAPHAMTKDTKPLSSEVSFEIRVDGKSRTFRDVRQTAIEAGIFLKRERPQSEVCVRDIRDNSVTMIDEELIAI